MPVLVTLPYLLCQNAWQVQLKEGEGCLDTSFKGTGKASVEAGA